MQEITVGKTYKHFKGNLYKIIAFAKDSETLEDLIVYESIDKKHVWVRPKKMWNEIIDNNQTKRFEIIENIN